MIDKPKDGDIYRWRWNAAEREKRKVQNQSGTLYWCCSCICVFQDGEFVDTYWGDSGGNRSFSIEKAAAQLDLEYVANFNDLTEADKNQRAYYKDSDCVDISHPNKSRGGFYIKNGAEKSLDKMRKVMARMLKKCEREAKYAQQQAERIKADIVGLQPESYLPITGDVSLLDESYEDSP